MRGEKLIARLPGIVHGVVVQITRAAVATLRLKSDVPAADIRTGNFTHTWSET
jgi:hypothetical protein